MKKEDWEKAKSRLRAPLGRVDLLCDGYSVTLVNECISICIRSVAQAVADAVLAVCKERKLTDAKLYTSHWA